MPQAQTAGVQRERDGGHSGHGQRAVGMGEAGNGGQRVGEQDGAVELCLAQVQIHRQRRIAQGGAEHIHPRKAAGPEHGHIGDQQRHGNRGGATAAEKTCNQVVTCADQQRAPK